MAATSELGTRVPRKAKAILDRLVASRSMTKEGMEWLICATDPFHDDRVRCPGYPDLNTVNSVVQTYTTTVSVINPGTNAFDVHFDFIPVTAAVFQVNGDGARNLGPAKYNHNGLYATTAHANVPNLGPGWNIIRCANSGEDWYDAPTGTVINDNGLMIPQKYCSGHFRLIATGLEVVNTTADLYKGGAVTTYRAPSDPSEVSVVNPVLTTFKPRLVHRLTPTTTKFQKLQEGEEVPVEPDFTTIYFTRRTPCVSLPPSTQLEAATYTDSRTWAAEDGCYVIATQNEDENPFLTPNVSDVVVKKTYDSTTQIAEQNAATQRHWWTSYVPSTGPYGVGAAQSGSCMKVLPFDNCGAKFVALNPNSTLQATVRYYFERIPATTEPDLLAMAQVPPASDAVAREIYSRCLSEMPVGVPVSENPLGEWFNSVLDTIKSVAPKIGGIVSGVGRAITEIGGTSPVQSNATPQRKMNKKQKARSVNLKSRLGNPVQPKKKAKKKKKRNGKA